MEKELFAKNINPPHMTTKKHSRSYLKKSKEAKKMPGVFPVFSPESTSYSRLKWYTAGELEARRQKMARHLDTIQNPHLRKKIRFEIKTIKSILS